MASNTVFVSNDAFAEGGGLLFGGTNSFYNCTISKCGISSFGYGGGGLKNFGTTLFVNCTLSENVADHCPGGGIYNLSILNLTNCTVSGNACNTGTGLGGAGILNTKTDVSLGGV